MFKHTVTYVDFNNNPHVEDLYFHMLVPEFADLEFNPMFETSLSDWIKSNMSAGEGRKVHTVFKLLVANSYGRRSEDGSRFNKNAQWTEDFLNSPAWEQFFLWLTDSEDGSHGQAFFNGIVPESLRGKLDAELASSPAKKSLNEMSREELEAAFLEKTKPAGSPKVIDA